MLVVTCHLELVIHPFNLAPEVFLVPLGLLQIALSLANLESVLSSFFLKRLLVSHVPCELILRVCETVLELLYLNSIQVLDRLVVLLGHGVTLDDDGELGRHLAPQRMGWRYLRVGHFEF